MPHVLRRDRDLLRRGNFVLGDAGSYWRLGFFAAAAVMKFYPRFRDKIPVQLEVAVITFFSAIAFIFVVVELMMGFSSISFQKRA